MTFLNNKKRVIPEWDNEVHGARKWELDLERARESEREREREREKLYPTQARAVHSMS